MQIHTYKTRPAWVCYHARDTCFDRTYQTWM